VKSHSVRWLIGVGAAIVAAAILYSYFTTGEGTNSVGGPAALAGKTAPSFTVAGIDGKPNSLKMYRGNVIVLNLWATWCPPCRAEMPDLERLYTTYRSRGVVVLGADQGESAATAASFARSLGITYPLLIDRDQQYGRVYAALGLPTSIIIGRDGAIVHGYDGVLTYSQMQTAVAPLLDNTTTQ